jgi:hypothetical protein
MLIQYFLILVILVILYRTFGRWRQGSLDFKAFIFWLCFWVLAGMVVIRPESTNFIANMLGVGRGADMVVYLSIIFIFYLIFQITIKTEKIERNITKIVREMAIKQTTDVGKNEGRQDSRR